MRDFTAYIFTFFILFFIFTFAEITNDPLGNSFIAYLAITYVVFNGLKKEV